MKLRLPTARQIGLIRKIMRRFNIRSTHRLGVLVFLLCVSVFYSGMATQGLAIEPNEVLVLANKNAWHSVGLAKYYMKQREIPDENLVKLWITDKTWCSREHYERKVVP